MQSTFVGITDMTQSVNMTTKPVAMTTPKASIAVTTTMGIKVPTKVASTASSAKGIFFCSYISLEILVRKFIMHKCHSLHIFIDIIFFHIFCRFIRSWCFRLIIHSLWVF